jgi:ornithine carbamoyltransferase
MATGRVKNVMSLADLSVDQIKECIALSRRLKAVSRNVLPPNAPTARAAAWNSANYEGISYENKNRANDKRDNLQTPKLSAPPQTLQNMSIALLFSKRSTRTRVAAETATNLLGGQALFLGKDDIQLNVNETPRDTAEVLSRMVQGIFARVGEHEEVEVSHSIFVTSEEKSCQLKNVGIL